ncbi:MAG: Tol-Pal system beta propeller repeat protein TolB, partial [Thermodesulfobacteriota bacterium]
FTLGGEELTLELRLYDVLQQKMLLGKRYTGARKDGRKMINRFTNEILFVLTGEYGVFGSQIVFVAGSRSAKSVMLTEFGGQEVEGVAGGPGPSFAPIMSPGGAIAYIHRNGRSWELKLGGQVVSAGPLHLSPAFMPDGSILAAMSGKHSTNIYRFSGPGARPAPVTNLPGINISPTVSPDGSLMAFVSDRAGSPQIYISSTGGGAVRRLTTVGSENLDPDWSPKGDRITFSSKGDIFTIRPDGSELQQLTLGQGHNTRPTWSPDGRMICFATTRAGRSQLYVMTANGDMQRSIMPDYTGDQRDPYWCKAMPAGTPGAGE